MLREVLSHADTGQFNERSWAYWHYRLGLASMDNVLALPIHPPGVTRDYLTNLVASVHKKIKI